jgi:hypothetical protein
MKKVELKVNRNQMDDFTGVFAISIVKSPAIQRNFIKLAEEKPVQMVLSNQEQRIITGPALIPDKMIYRNAESLGGEEGYVYFSQNTIKEVAELFLGDLRNNNTTLEHQEKCIDLALVESWIVQDPGKDKSYALGIEVPAGTWMVSYKVLNDQLWEEIKSGKYNGFSIEANMVAQVIAQFSEKQVDKPVEDRERELINSILKTIEEIFEKS